MCDEDIPIIFIEGRNKVLYASIVYLDKQKKIIKALRTCIITSFSTHCDEQYTPYRDL